MKKLIFIVPVIAVIMVVVGVAVVSSKSGDKSGTLTKLNIVAAENFYGDIAARIGGTSVNVTSLLSNPNQDPHEYEATSADARSINDADIVIENGIGYDPFMQQVLSTTAGKDVIDVGQLAGLTEQDNPHIWYNLNYITEYAGKLRDELTTKDPAHAADYQTNYTTFINSLNTITTVCDNVKQGFEGTQVIATERVADYMLTNCGLRPIQNDFQKAVEEGNDPSVDAINFFENALNTHQAKVLIYNEQTQSTVTEKEQALAGSDHIPVVGVTETMPLDSNYVDWMVSQLNALKTALTQ